MEKKEKRERKIGIVPKGNGHVKTQRDKYRVSISRRRLELGPRVHATFLARVKNRLCIQISK